ncbi:hypothetical protein [Schlesneria paludicola]|uniref:hypothetical protein n=1 Tax=Schlesneria paludicola TaxID=360056 RepID=UPI000299D514|nr:hypothetical protein [Schlesneria paludicola]
MFFSNRLHRPLIWTLSATLLICGALVFHFTKRRPPPGYASYYPDPAESLQSRATKPARTKTESAFARTAPADERRLLDQSVLPAIGAPPPLTSPRSDQPDERDAQLDRDAKTLAAKLLVATPEGAVELRKQLESVIERHFEYRQQQRKQEIEQLSQRVDALRLSQVRRQENKAEVVKRRVNDLIDPTANLDWETSRSTDEAVKEKFGVASQGSVLVPNAQPLADEFMNTDISVPAAAGDPGLPAPSVSISPSVSNPTFQGKPLSAWLQKLETERDPSALSEAINALKHLSADAEPRVLIRAIILMAQSIGLRVPFDGNLRRGVERVPEIYIYSLVDKSIELLRNLPPSILVEELIQQPTKNPSRQVTNTYQAIFNGLLVAADQADQINLVVDARQSKSTRVNKGLAREFSEHAQELINALVILAKRDDTLEDWVVDSSIRILSLNDESLAEYPDLVPMVQRFFFNESNSFETRGQAAVILGRSGLFSGQVLAFLQMALEPQSAGDARQIRQRNDRRVRAWVKRLVPDMPEVATLFKIQIADQTGKLQVGHSDDDVIESIRLLKCLVDLREFAESDLPFLRQLAEKTIAETPTEYEQIVDYDGNVIRPRFSTLREYIKDAIHHIEVAVSESKSKRAVIHVDSPERISLHVGPRAVMSEQSAAASPREPTFDGRAYSSWLEILETERKPEMLEAAIDACSRLAQPKDQTRIVRGILQAASLFQGGDVAEEGRVWNAALTGLNRLSGAVILDNLIAAAKDNDSPMIHRAVQFRTWDQLQSATFREAVKSRSNTIMTEFDGSPAGDRDKQDDLVALASCVWRLSDRPLDDFPGLKKRMIDLVDSGRGLPADASYLAYASPWHVTAANLVSLAPDTPGLGVMIVKLARSRADVVQILGRLGPAAEAAVPALVDLFLEEQSSFLRQREPGDFLIYANHNQYLMSIILTLQNIGGDPKGYALLRELNLAVVSYYGTTAGSQISRSVVDAFAQYKAPNSPEIEKQLLDDRVLINGLWTHRATKRHPGLSAKVLIQNQNWKFTDTGSMPNPIPYAFAAGQWNCQQFERITVLLQQPAPIDLSSPLKERPHPFEYRLLNNFRLDLTSTPRQIHFHGTNDDGVEVSQLGIYELTETTLRVQLAPIGEPRPTEFIADEVSLPQGHVLLELERKLDNKIRPIR